MKAEARNKIKKIVLYLLDTNNKDVVNHYVDMVMEIVDEVSRERAIDFANHLSEIVSDGDDLYKFEEEYDNWLKE